MNLPRFIRRGFTLTEVLVWAVASAGVMSAVVYAFHYTVENAISPSITSSGLVTERAPSHKALADAMNLHHRLRADLEEADLVFVFGGEGANPVQARWNAALGSGALPAGAQPPAFTIVRATKPDYLPAALAFINSTNDPRTFTNAYDAMTQPGGINISNFVTESAHAAAPTDFSLFCLRNDGSVISITQCNRKVDTFVDKSVVVYTVKYYDPTQLGVQEAYSFFLPESSDRWAMPVGAKHFWFRYDGVSLDGSHLETSWMRHEPGPIRVVFPDPFALPTSSDSAVATSSANNTTTAVQRVAPFSRFTYMVMPTR